MTVASFPPLAADAGTEIHPVLGEAPLRPAANVWLITFTDLVLLLLTFFVLLFAMSDIDLGRFSAMNRSAGLADGSQIVGAAPEPGLDYSIPQRQVFPGGELGYLRAVVSRALSEGDQFGVVSTRLTNEYLILSLPGALFFAPGSAELTNQARDSLFQLAPLLDALDNELAVTGHVGPSGVQNAPFVSDWELSLARAIAVSKALSDSGVRQSMTVLGRGNMDYSDRAQDLPALAQAALALAADRVDILIFPHEPEMEM